MARRSKGIGLHHHRSDFRHLDGFAATILLSARQLAEVELKAKPEG
jgi:hypothetical protein